MRAVPGFVSKGSSGRPETLNSGCAGSHEDARPPHIVSPWLIFAALAVYTPVPFEIILLLSLAASLLVGYRDLKDRFIIAWTTTLFFTAVSVLVLAFCWFDIVPLLGVASNGVLLLVTVGSLRLGVPFTEQYARREVPEEEWTDPFFL